MASKNDIINNLREYSSDQIVEAINSGIVTIYELSKSGNLTPLMRRRIEEKLATKQNELKHEPQKDEIQNASIVSLPNIEEISVEEDSSIPEAVIPTAFIDSGIPTPISTPEPIIKATSSTTDAVISNKGIFKRPFSFKGRIRRIEYGISFLLYYFWYFILSSVSDSSNSNVGVLTFFLITTIPMIWFLWAQSCKRCHDRGNSGWYQLIPFYFFILLFGDGEKGVNDYGENPKE